MDIQDIEDKLIVGARIKIGQMCAKITGSFDAGEVIELVEGSFEYDNGLYIEDQKCPAVWDKGRKEFDSIYHLFGNNLEDFLDSEILSK